jgi:hypothetical protein
MTARAILVALALLLGACATSTPQISDEERCLRFGGLWHGSWCRYEGGGGM